jgi:hypothetical protein
LVGTQCDHGSTNECTGMSRVSWKDAFVAADECEKKRKKGTS